MLENSITTLIITEKASVARDIARVLGCSKKWDTYLTGTHYAISWAVGHVLTLAEPHEINPKWKKWLVSDLPILPKTWPLTILQKTASQFEALKKLLAAPQIKTLICATDAGREGELIFRYIYEKCQCTHHVKRLWISSLTQESIQQGMKHLKDSTFFDTLAESARARSQADWLVGMNLSRYYSLRTNNHFSIGRVQTPTLAMIVERSLAIKNFIPKPYREIIGTFTAQAHTYKGIFLVDVKKQITQLPPLPDTHAETVAQRDREGTATVSSIKKEVKKQRPPLLYDLTELQRHANRLRGMSAEKTLKTAQNLYETHKLISYPRTDSRYLSSEVAKEISPIINTIIAPYQELCADGTGKRPIDNRFVNNAKITDHHALIPTTVHSASRKLTPDEEFIYDLICRRLLSAWHDDYITATTTLLTTITPSQTTQPNQSWCDIYQSKGVIELQLGWKVLEPKSQRMGKRTTQEEEPQIIPDTMVQKMAVAVTEITLVNKKTQPPKQFNDATLLTAMESAGKTLEDKELSQAMKDHGLGTPATRASIIETLLERTYIERKGTSLIATDRGIQLIACVHPQVKSPALTGQWECRLRDIEGGTEHLKNFIHDVEEFIRYILNDKIENSDSQVQYLSMHAQHANSDAHTKRSIQAQPDFLPSSTDLQSLLKSRFGFTEFRPFQKDICEAVSEGKDVLCVMPTGAGKSLCYQLPGIARKGTTLVISPLIALIEDQVAALTKKGFSAERIHSGRLRTDSQRVCSQYLQGTLDFLFIAPERLKVQGFPAFLAKRKPVLIAIDEAHCISNWGHDFRPDYRMLSKYIPLLRPVPVIALTATAIPLVQRDIVEQLGLCQEKPFIHGFRRDNIAIEVVNVLTSKRSEMIREILSDSQNRPAIIYAPTRKSAEDLAQKLHDSCKAEAYHAGMPPAQRDQVQERFKTGLSDVIVATIAFGMGIDKSNIRTVIHAALPGSIEAYYQEIGRAGRDGKLSRAILLYSWADNHTHEFFHDKAYPDISVLTSVASKVTVQKISKDDLFNVVHINEELFNTALEKLWIHGGVIIDSDDSIRLGHSEWETSYATQKKFKLKQLHEMLNFTATPACRMIELIAYFGDQDDCKTSCGICDICSPKTSIVGKLRKARTDEIALIQSILRSIQQKKSIAKGTLFRDLCDTSISRTDFEEIIYAMAGAKLIQITHDSFQKEGERIEYQRVNLTQLGIKALQKDQILAESIDIKFIPELQHKPAKLKKSQKQYKKTVNTDSLPTQKSAASGLITALREWRKVIATKRHVPAFCILSDKVLHSIAQELPKTPAMLMKINGIGSKKIEKYGHDILQITNKH